MERQPRVSRHEWAWCVAFVAAAALLLGVAANILRPAREAFGSTWNAYLAEPRDTVDVLFWAAPMPTATGTPAPCTTKAA